MPEGLVDALILLGFSGSILMIIGLALVKTQKTIYEERSGYIVGALGTLMLVMSVLISVVAESVIALA